MANQPENPVWEAGIYQFETTDPIEGGLGGIDNRPLLELANRTRFLYDKLIPHLPLFRGAVRDIVPGETSGTKTVDGQLTSCVVNYGNSSNNFSTYLVTLPSAMPSTNYFVRITLEFGTVGTGTGTAQKKAYEPTFVPYSTTQFFFTIGLQEMTAPLVNIKAHIEVISLD